jgi:opacity protein-like surface antigen
VYRRGRLQGEAMSMYKYGMLVMSIFVIALFISPVCTRADTQKITVMVQNASIRLKPDMGSEVIGEPSIGTMFETVQKVGSWYEIKYRTEIGVMITGYIHEMFVQPVSAPSPLPHPVSPPKAAKATKISLRLAAMYYLIQAGYDYNYSFFYRNEISTIYDSAENANAVGFDVGIGVFATPNIEITGSVAYYSKSLTGNFGWSVPNPYFYGYYASDEIATSPSLKETILGIGINFYPVTDGVIQPYLGVGACYILGSMDLVEDAVYTETILPDSTHSIEINSVQFEETKINNVGISATAGVNCIITKNVTLFAEGNYYIASSDVLHPLTSQFDKKEQLSIDLGGASVNFGIKYIF